MNKIKLSTQILAATLTLACLPVAKGGADTSVFKDDFTEVAASEVPESLGLNAASWYFVGQTGGTPWTVGEDSVSPLSGPVLENQGSSSGWQSAVKQFPATTLSKTGDSLTVKLDYHAKASAEDGRLDVAFLSSPNSITNNSFTEPDRNPLLNAKGYSVYQPCKTIAEKSRFIKIKNAAESFDSPKTTLESCPTSSVLGDAGKAHSLMFSITKGESGIKVVWSVDGVAMDSAFDMDSPLVTFNTLRLMAPSDTPTHLDNISVVANLSK